MSAVDVCYAPNSMHEIAVFHEDVAQRHRHMTYWEQAIKGLPFTVKVRHVAGTIANGNPSNITSCRGSECRIFASNPFAAFAREAGMEDKIMSYYQLDHAPEECSECEYIRDLKAELAKGNKDEEAE